MIALKNIQWTNLNLPFFIIHSIHRTGALRQFFNGCKCIHSATPLLMIRRSRLCKCIPRHVTSCIDITILTPEWFQIAVSKSFFLDISCLVLTLFSSIWSHHRNLVTGGMQLNPQIFRTTAFMPMYFGKG